MEHNKTDSGIHEFEVMRDGSKPVLIRKEPAPKDELITFANEDAPKKGYLFWGLAAIGVLAISFFLGRFMYQLFIFPDTGSPETTAEGGTTARPHVAPAAEDPGRPVRPDLWYGGTHVSALPTAEDEERFRTMLSELVFPGRDTGEPVPPDSILNVRIGIAQLIIASTDRVPHAWEWERVRRTIAAFDHGIPVRQNARMEADLMWTGNRALLVNPGRIRTMSNEELEASLIHEATHAVYDELVREATGYTDLDLLGIHSNCIDWAVMNKFTTEALAFGNEAVWFYRDRPPAHDMRNGNISMPWNRAMFHGREGMERIQEERYCAVLGDPECLHHVSFYTYLYATDEVGREATVNGTYQQCGPVPILYGMNRHEWFYPTDVAPEIVPLWNALQSDWLNR